MKMLVSGANGFVGRALCGALSGQGDAVRAAVRSAQSRSAGASVIGTIDGETDWANALSDATIVVHLAARVHIRHDDAEFPLEAFRRVNVAGTEHLARCAAASGVRRFVYVSSIKVNGEETCGAEKFTETDMPSPQDEYGISKWEAEQALHLVARETGLEVVIVRSPAGLWCRCEG